MRKFLVGLFFVVAVLVTLWAAGAFYFDFPLPALRLPLAILYPVAIALALKLRHRSRGVVTAWILSLTAILIWWFSLKPSNDRDWQRDVDRVGWAEISGNQATIHNIRNFDYVTEKNFTPHWETKTVDISNIRGVDVFFNYWGLPLIAHVIPSFRFADGTHLATSVEARKTTGQEYSAIRGFYRQYTLLYLMSEERDVVAVRTNQRREQVYLYRTLTTPHDAQNLFREYLGWMNQAREQPEWYNAITASCVTNFVRYLAKTGIGGVSAWDWRTLLDGRADEMLYDLGDLAGNLPFPELKKRALTNAAAQSDGASPNFSRAIRVNRPGFEQLRTSEDGAHLEVPFAVP